MQKIKITSTSRITKPKSLENIDISYGVSYVTKNNSVKTFDDISSWSMKLLATINDFVHFFSPKNQDQETIEQIIEHSNFLNLHQSEDSKNLHIQLNQENKMTKSVKFISGFIKKHRETIERTLDANVANFRFSYDDKKIFLGLNNFKKDNIVYDRLSEELNKKEIISHIFFHEYSHSVELSNYSKYEMPLHNEQLNKLYINIRSLMNKENYKKVEKLIEGKNNFSMPDYFLIQNLNTLHKEIYADVNAILLMRNKDLIDGNFNEEHFQKTINATINIRNSEQRRNKNDIESLFVNSSYIYPYNAHFTTPGVEAINDHLTKILKNHPKDKILTNEEMHQVVLHCVEEGIAKTILVMKQIIPSIECDLHTILHLKSENDQCVIDETTLQYEKTMQKIQEVVPEEWKDRFLQNLIEPFKKNAFNIFDAAMDYEQFDKVRKINEVTQSVNNTTEMFVEINKNNVEINTIQSLNDSKINSEDLLLLEPLLFEMKNLAEKIKEKDEVTKNDTQANSQNQIDFQEPEFTINIEEIALKKIEGKAKIENETQSNSQNKIDFQEPEFTINIEEIALKKIEGKAKIENETQSNSQNKIDSQEPEFIINKEEIELKRIESKSNPEKDNFSSNEPYIVKDIQCVTKNMASIRNKENVSENPILKFK